MIVIVIVIVVEFVVVVVIGYIFIISFSPASPRLGRCDDDDGASDESRSDHFHRRHDFSEEEISEERRGGDVSGVEDVADNPGVSGAGGFQFLTTVDGSGAINIADQPDLKSGACMRYI